MTESIYERVKKRAYEIWEEEGRPWGRDAIHWEKAHQEIAAAGPTEVAAAVTPAPAPATKAAAKKPAALKAATGKAPAKRGSKKTTA